MADMILYRCPNCGGEIEFDTQTQKLVCPYCDSEFEVEDLKQHEEFLNKKDDTSWDAYEQRTDSNLVEYSCNNCGGEIICEPTTAATTCPYCDSPVVLSKKVTGTLCPDYVIPFQYNKEQAKLAMQKHFKGKLLLPNDFKNGHKLEDIRGVYVPFWLFDCEADATIRFKATKVRSWSDRRYRYTKTSYYKLLRDGTLQFDKVPVDGSKQMDNTYMEAIEPYDYSKLVAFEPGYLAGYVADRYDVDANAAIPRANQRIKNSTVEQLKSTARGYNTCVTEEVKMNYNKQKTHYALLPVWMLHTTYRGKKYVFAMNAQTEKFIGELPMSVGKFWGLVCGSMLATVPIAYLLLLLIMAFL